MFGALNPGSPAYQLAQLRQLAESIHGDNAIHHLAGEQLQAGSRTGNIRARVTQQDAIAIFLRLLLNAFDHLCAEWVRDIGNQYQNHRAARRTQLARQQIRLIVALFDCLKDFLPVSRFYAVAVIQHTGNGGDRHTRHPGDFLNRHSDPSVLKLTRRKPLNPCRLRRRDPDPADGAPKGRFLLRQNHQKRAQPPG